MLIALVVVGAIGACARVRLAGSSRCCRGARRTTALIGVVEARTLELDAACVKDALGGAATIGTHDVRVLRHTVLDLKDFAA